MNIEDIYSNAKEKVIDFLLRYLSQHNISYVRIDVEDNSLDDTLEKICKTLNELEVSKRLSLDDGLIGFTIAEGRADNKYSIPDYNSNKKKLIKMQNRINNLKIRNSKK